MTLYAVHNFITGIYKVFFITFSVGFIIKEADSMHKLGFFSDFSKLSVTRILRAALAKFRVYTVFQKKHPLILLAIS